MKKMKGILLALSVAALLSSCYSSSHIVGSGGKGGEVIAKKQWFALYGLAPLNTVNSKELAGTATDYTVTTKFTFVDHLIGAVTGFLTIRPMTVQVQK